MTTREQAVAQVVTDILDYFDDNTRDNRDAEYAARQIIATLLPQVTTVAELDALPPGSLVLTTLNRQASVHRAHAGIVCTSHWLNDDKTGEKSFHRWLASVGPLTVVWQPEAQS